jgi:hypothetical protein
MDKITQISENVVRCNYFEAGVHIKNPIKNSYQDGLGRTTQTLDHVVVVHILIWDKRKSQIFTISCTIHGNDPAATNTDPAFSTTPCTALPWKFVSMWISAVLNPHPPQFPDMLSLCIIHSNLSFLSTACECRRLMPLVHMISDQELSWGSPPHWAKPYMETESVMAREMCM